MMPVISQQIEINKSSMMSKQILNNLLIINNGTESKIDSAVYNPTTVLLLSAFFSGIDRCIVDVFTGLVTFIVDLGQERGAALVAM